MRSVWAVTRSSAGFDFSRTRHHNRYVLARRQYRNDCLPPALPTPPVIRRHQLDTNSTRDGTGLHRQPLVTGTSVLGIKYADGIMLAADNLGQSSEEERFSDRRRS